MNEVTGHPVTVEQAPARQEAARLVADNHRITTTLGWLLTRSSAKALIRDAWEADQ